ncbi:MAG: tRNA 2-selenouridine(34) synthase MnmH [Bacteroidales bacterium]|nr:tRNA 2-selenouridine(34) synthase MnmH [Bacteroidales bacterium]MCF8334163.1 tRNA 2-selenouridine(34) synthase MnmH [Bacteroidales bacterium]
MKLAAEEFLKLSDTIPVVDVRSPKEFGQGHIPEARSLPLFDNDERATVGTLYKQSGRYAAILRGLDIVGPKMSSFLKKGVSWAQEGRILIHCWRGGMRSESMAWLFEKADLQADILYGGYKAYRRHIRRAWTHERPLVILGGKTGCGKTEILHELQKSGKQVLDLEGIAHHKGSAFGAIGQNPQPTNEQYENNLASHWRRFDPTKPVWLEDESRAIGAVSIPEPLYNQMYFAPVIDIHIPKSERIKRLVNEYACFEKGKLEAALHRISKKLGGQNEQAAVKALHEDDYETVADIALWYYDKAYANDLKKREQRSVFPLNLQEDDPVKNAEEVRRFYYEEVLKKAKQWV